VTKARDAVKSAMRSKTAAFPPFSKNGPPPPVDNGPSKRDIPKDHAYDPRSLKPMSKALWAASMALGHTLAAYRELSRLKSATVSPDGMMGGRGYVMQVRTMRQKLFEASEAMSAIADTLYDEINAPHWKPKLALLDENDAEDVSRFVEKSQDILENPEDEANEEMKDIEEENDGKFKSKKDKDEAKSSEMPGGGSSVDGEETLPPESPTTKQASTLDLYTEMPISSLVLPERVLARIRAANSSVPVDSLGGPRVDHIGPAEGAGPWGSYNDDEPLVADPWGQDEGGAGRRDDHGEDYDYTSEWENDLSRSAGHAKEAIIFHTINEMNRYKKEHPKADMGKHKVDKGKDDKKPAPKKEQMTKEERAEQNERIEQAKIENHKKREKAVADAAQKEKDDYDKLPKWKKLFKKNPSKEASSGIPDSNSDPTPTEAWDFGIGYGARGQGAGGYQNPSGEGDGTKGVWGPHAGLPGSPSQSPGDSSMAPAVDQALNERHSQGDEAWMPTVVNRPAQLPQDAVGPPARSDYFRGPKDNLVQGEAELPGDGNSAWVSQDFGSVDTGYVSEDVTTPYVRYDHTTRNERPEHQHGRPEDLPWAQDGEASR